ncbi:metallopeptidase TldD-related protein [Oscillatoria sp. FACHB-1406]|uniref:TldD/PmbA family protein n=1 Tax=Oscillatoria sp. FACHB-1406 TaxID=2692846 RepID=UPI001682C16D|nr:metallopeptidase TldD-related protein [Oscillatoria sp. FACHB-1406]MBD2578194.1 TldD/PmbA family protein [Oscillatoria sp. FACHB-1406]
MTKHYPEHRQAEDLAAQLLDLAARAGAERAEVYHSQALSRPVFFEANRLKQLEISESEGTALRIWRSGCPGLAVAYGQVDLQALVEKAIALSHLTTPETPEMVEGETHIFPDLGEEMAVEELVKLGRDAIAHLRERYPEVLCGAELECERETTTLINSRGLYCQYTDITLSCFLGAEWVRGEDFLGIYESQEIRGQLNLVPMVRSMLTRLDWAARNTKSLSGRIPILFTNNAAPLLWETVSEALSGKLIAEGASPWTERQDESVIADCLTLRQKPTEGPYSCPFDDEGTLTQSFALIEGGKMKQAYCDRATGRLLGIPSTGNGFRPSLGRYPTPELINLAIDPGRGSLENLIASIDRGILVDRVLGDGADISGDFSVNIDLGYRIENGAIVGRVKDTMVAGNVYTALKQVIALGGDAVWNSACYTPSILVSGLSVVGGS